MTDGDLDRQRTMVAAFFAAARGGDLDALVALLDPDVVLRSDWGASGPVVVRGAAAVARLPHVFNRPAAQLHPVLVNGAAGAVVTVAGRPIAVMGFTVAEGKIVEIDAITEPERVRRLYATM